MGLQEWLFVLVLLEVLSFALLASVRWYPRYPQMAGKIDADARLKATELLREVLSEAERRQLAETRFLMVPSPSVASRVYRIPAMGGMVEVYDSGKLSSRLCVQPAERLPAADMVVVHKVMIEGSEGEYQRTANVVRLA